jgi:hypothetical protein
MRQLRRLIAVLAMKGLQPVSYACVCERVEGINYANQLEGACIGVFKPQIIARVLCLDNRQKVKTEAEIEMPLFS